MFRALTKMEKYSQKEGFPRRSYQFSIEQDFAEKPTYILPLLHHIQQYKKNDMINENQGKINKKTLFIYTSNLIIKNYLSIVKNL